VGYVSLIGNCGRIFASNPDYVPSLRLTNGRKLVFCRDCVEAANPERIRRGLLPIVIDALAHEPQEA
jgi:hypothetical protein